MRKFLPIFMLATCLTACHMQPAFAQEACTPLEANVRALVENGVAERQIVIVRGREFVETFNASIGLSVPEDARPVGMIFVAVGTTVVMGIIEDGDCIRYVTRTSAENFARAWQITNRAA